MKLFLLRHAKARDTWPDADRELTKAGSDQVEKLASAVDSAQFCDVVQVWHSPYARAEQTARIFTEKTFMTAQFVPTPTITPEDNPYDTARIVASLSCFGKDLMIVSHNPFLENLADILLAGHKRGGRVVFGKCTLACLSLEEPPTPDREYGLWALDFLISPKIMR